MTAVEIIEKLKRHVESSREFGGGWSPDSESYAGIFFRLFREARDRGYLSAGSPLLTGDAMTNFIRENAIEGEDGWLEFYEEKWDRVCVMWRHWSQYAKFDALNESEYV